MRNRVRRSHPSIPLGLSLTGLESRPRAGYQFRMAAFDQLRPEIQRFLADCPFEFNAEKALKMQAERGPRYTLDMLRRSVPVEVERFSRERNDALVWAQRTFTNSPRKVRTKTLKLSFFELAEQAERGVNLDEYVVKRLKDAGAADPGRAIRFDDPADSQVVFTFTVRV